MPFTFTHAIDPMLATPTMQATVAGSLLTVGLVAPTRDASAGALWRVLRDGAWQDTAEAPDSVVLVRRVALKPSPTRRTGSLMIGVELDGRHWRIACEGVPSAEELQACPSGAGTRPTSSLVFRAHSIRPSAWAGRSRPPAALWQEARRRWQRGAEAA